MPVFKDGGVNRAAFGQLSSGSVCGMLLSLGVREGREGGGWRDGGRRGDGVRGDGLCRKRE